MPSIIIDRKAGLSSATAIKGPCRLATTGAITLSGEQTVDGVLAVTGDRVLVKDQPNLTENGLYIVDTGDWQRAKDFSRNDDVVEGTRVAITDGEDNGLTTWQVFFGGDLVIGTTLIVFAALSLDFPDTFVYFVDEDGNPLTFEDGDVWVQEAELSIRTFDGAVLVKVTISGFLDTIAGFTVSGTQVVGPRDTGWAAMTGTADKATAYTTSAITLEQLAQRVAALQSIMTTHGLIGH